MEVFEGHLFEYGVEDCVTHALVERPRGSGQVSRCGTCFRRNVEQILLFMALTSPTLSQWEKEI